MLLNWQSTTRDQTKPDLLSARIWTRSECDLAIMTRVRERRWQSSLPVPG